MELTDKSTSTYRKDISRNIFIEDPANKNDILLFTKFINECISDNICV